jgi:hypothetical protein
MRSGIWYGVDAAPVGEHIARVEIFGGEVVDVRAVAEVDYDATFVVIEDPCGILFKRTNSIMWSLTCRTAGELFGAHETVARYLSPSVARQWLAQAAGQSGRVQKDAEVRECLEVIFGQLAFAKGKLCPKRKGKRHGADCDACDGTGMKQQPGCLSALNSAHLRDAFVVAIAAASGVTSDPYHGCGGVK